MSDICKRGSCLSSWVRGTQCAIWIRDEVVLVASLKNEAYTHFWILVAGCLNSAYRVASYEEVNSTLINKFLRTA